MKKRLLLLLLCLAVMLSLSAPAAAKSYIDEDVEPLLVRVNVYSNLFGTDQILGVYRENTFYISAGDFASMTGATVLKDDACEMAFSMHGGLRYFYLTDESVITECIGGSQVCQDMETVVYENRLYVSAPDILHYAGATVGFGRNELSEVHMMVTMPYTVLDLLCDYAAVQGYAFSWSEADGGMVDPEDLLGLAALDTMVFSYDANLVACVLPAYGDHVEQTIHLDAIKELLQAEGENLVSHEDISVELLSFLSDGTDVSVTWLQETLEWVAQSDVDKKLAKKWGKYMDATGLVVTVTSGIINSVETAKQFANMTETQKNLLEYTMCRVGEQSGLYKSYPLMFDAANEAHSLITGEYSAAEKAAWDSMYVLLGEAVDAYIPDEPITIAFDVMSGIASLTSLTESLLEAEKNLVFASECSDIRVLADCILEADRQTMVKYDYMLGDMDVCGQECLKYDMVLGLKSALVARLFVIESGFLTDESQSAMESKCTAVAQLLNKAQNARPTALGVFDKNTQDISWIEKLACVGKMGNVVTVGTNTYYWRYNDSSFQEDGYSAFSKMATTNSFICRDKDGKQTTLFALGGYGEFVIANGILFYQNNSMEICSITLDGKERKNWGTGSLCAVTKDGGKIICFRWGGDNGLDVIDLQDETRKHLVYAQQFVTLHDGVIYYTEEVDYQKATKGMVKLCSIHPDGTNRLHLYTTQPDLYEYEAGYSSAAVDQIRFTEDYIYFSYGSMAGSGAFYQGGKVARVRYDGTGGQIVAGQNELVDGQFTVSADNQVTTQQIGYNALWSAGCPLYISDGYIYRYDENSGEPVLMVVPEDYANLGCDLAGVESKTGTVIVDFVEQRGNKVYYLLHRAGLSGNSVWWASYTRETTAMLVKDLETGKVTVLFKF